MPQMRAIYECSRIARRRNIPVIADGGMKYSGDITKAVVKILECLIFNFKNCSLAFFS